MSPVHSRRAHPASRTLLTVFGLALAVALCWWPQLNTVADDAVDAGLKRALVSFATARTLHGVISVVQGTEVAVQPMGMGVTLAPGQVLAPINDLAAQVADWMLWASVAFGLQKLLLAMGGSLWVSAVLSLVALSWAGAVLRGRRLPWLTRLLVLLLFARLVMPVTILSGEQLFTHFLAQPYQESQLASDGAARKLQMAAAPEPADAGASTPADGEASLLERLWQWGGNARDAVASPVETAQARLAQITAAVDRLVERLVTLIVVFALQTIVLPLLLAWGLLQLCRGFIQPANGS